MFVARGDTTGLDINVDVEVDATDYGRDNLAPRLPALLSTPEVSDGEL